MRWLASSVSGTFCSTSSTATPSLAQRADDLADLRDHARHQPLGRLVEQDDLRLQHHRPGDRQHLLLAARQRAAGLVAPLGEDREIGVDLVEQLGLFRLADAAPVEPGAQVLEHGEQAERCGGPRGHSRCRAAPPGATRAGRSSGPRTSPRRRSDGRGRRSPSRSCSCRRRCAPAGRPPRRARPRARRRAGCGSCRNRCGWPRPASAGRSRGAVLRVIS